MTTAALLVTKNRLKLGYVGRASYLNPEETKAVIEWIEE